MESFDWIYSLCALFSGPPVVASTIVQIQRLEVPDLLIEIRCVARVSR
jgi:2-iminobutanoate/2-iminopropanoate deaminase